MNFKSLLTQYRSMHTVLPTCESNWVPTHVKAVTQVRLQNGAWRPKPLGNASRAKVQGMEYQNPVYSWPKFSNVERDAHEVLAARTSRERRQDRLTVEDAIVHDVRNTISSNAGATLKKSNGVPGDMGASEWLKDTHEQPSKAPGSDMQVENTKMPSTRAFERQLLDPVNDVRRNEVNEQVIKLFTTTKISPKLNTQARKPEGSSHPTEFERRLLNPFKDQKADKVNEQVAKSFGFHE